MNSNYTALFSVWTLLLFANRAAVGQPPGSPRTIAPVAALPAAPMITILAAATGALVRSQSTSNASLDLGRVSYFKGASGPGKTSQKNPRSFVISTRFALKVDCPGSSMSSKVNLIVSRLDAAASHAITIDGTPVGSTAQTLVQSMPCGTGGEHRLDVEVPVSTPAGAIGKYRRVRCDAEKITGWSSSQDLPLFVTPRFGRWAGAQTPAPLPDTGDAMRASISLSPAIIMVRCKPGQSTTQTLTIVNRTANEVRFKLAIEDVVVREGKRSFSPAGQIANGIASSSVAAPASVALKAGEEASVHVTFTLPPETRQRAVVTFFRGGVVPAANGTVGLGASLGTLITFNVSGDYKLEAGPVQASLQTPAANVILSEELRNSGSEPVIPKGVVVILNVSGKRVAKAPFSPQRLLPGERLIFAATSPAQLAPGRYRTLSSFEFNQCRGVHYSGIDG